MLADGLGRWARPGSVLFGLGVAARAQAYERGWLPVARAPIPVISVGGLEAGGTGKTPVARWILQHLRKEGLRVGLLTRGYRRRSRGLVLRRPGEPAPADQVGDEPAMLVQGGLDIWMAVSGDRRVGAEALAREGVQVAVMDDGFSHRALARDLDVVVLRANAPWGTQGGATAGMLLPAGSLREPPAALRRAHVIWVHQRSPGAGTAPLPRLPPEAHVVVSRQVPGPVKDPQGAAIEVRGRSVMVVAGVARPREVVEHAEHVGARVVGFVPREDHCRYPEGHLRDIATAWGACQAAAVLVTAKDAAKLRGREVPFPWWVLHSQLEVLQGEAALHQRLAAVSAQKR